MTIQRLTHRTLLTAAGVLALAVTPLLAEDEAKAEVQRSPEAMRVLEAADTAIKAVHSVRYHSRVTADGGAAHFIAQAEGSGHMAGWTSGGPEKFYGTVTTTPPGADAAIKVEGGGNGDTFFVINHNTKKGYEDMDPAVLGSTGQALSTIGLMEYVHSNPFDDELAADTVEYLGEVMVDDEPCHKIHVVYSGGRGVSTWLFSKNDHLPRQRIRHFETPQGDGTMTITVSQVEVNPKIDPVDYTMQLPEGYEQIDDFAP